MSEKALDITSQSGALVEVEKQRALGGVMAAMSVAKRFPRDEAAAISQLTRSCGRVSLAEISQYSYSKGVTEVTGPTVHLLRAVAQAWGNLQSGWTELERSNGQSLVMAWAWDLQSNVREERSFNVRHWRDTKSGGYFIKDEREIYELCANQAARRVRACLQSIIPQDVLEIAEAECEKTLKKGGGVPLPDRIRAMEARFLEFGVTRIQIEKKLGHKIESTKETELAKMQKVFQSIRDGIGTVEDHFEPEANAALSKIMDDAEKKPAAATVTVDVAPPTPAPAPDHTPEPPADPADPLAEFVTGECKSSLDGLKATLVATGWDKTFKSIADAPSFADISADDRKRLLGAKHGLRVNLAKHGGAK